MLRLILSLVLLGASLLPARAQAPANYTELAAAMQAAQAQAIRPGDESLDCEALENELIAVANDPAFRSRAEAAGAAAQERAAASSGAAAGTSAALTMFSSMVPGGAMAGLAAMGAQGQVQQGQAAANLQMRMQQMQSMMAVLPQMMRGQRVIELAGERKCEWIAGAMPR